MRPLNFFYFIPYAIILTLSLYNFVNAFTPSRNASPVTRVTATVLTAAPHNASSSINYESAGRKPTTATQGSNSDEDEASQEDDDDDNEEDGADDNSSNETNEFEEDKNCTCSGSNCLCCINLNLSFIDLGGPGCVKFGYISGNDSLAVNMSYGGRLLESDTLKHLRITGTSSDPTCMDLFSDLAQMCAKFTGLTRVAKGVKGCISVEPLLLGVSQTSYDVGCFNMDVEGYQIQTPSTTQPPTSSNGTKNTTDKQEENEEEELEAAISQSAAEGINWFNNFIASVFGEESNDTAASESVEPYNNRTNTNKNNVKLS